MQSRRAFVRVAGWVGIASLIPCESSMDAISLPSAIGQDADFDGPLPKPPSKLGTRPPLDAEERVAKAIITGAPKGQTPFAIAKYFLAVGEGRLGAAWQPYASGWPVRWNPVIVEFFQATHTVPEGDITSWCAAFANWCFQRKNSTAATESASSGSFRTFGTATLQPKEGDIVVFRKTIEPESDPRGHVGFFVEDHGETVEVLGGNQIEGHERSHKVSSKRIPKSGAVLTLHSYRTDARLRA
jgi:uncharacterized protein (TIGR02594 family)